MYSWLADGLVGGEQLTLGALWRIRISKEICERFVEAAMEGYVQIVDALWLFGVSRQTVLQRVKSGVISAVYVSSGKRNGLYINVLDAQESFFDNHS